MKNNLKRQTIVQYSPCREDLSLDNPYLKDVLALINDIKKRHVNDSELELLKYRNEYIMKYAFSIPVYPALNAIAAFEPLVEIGAGTGYWAWCLAQMGADVHAYDIRPPGENDPWLWNEGNRWFDDTWFHVEQGDESIVDRYPDRSLMLAWPELHDHAAYRALSLYRQAGGTRLIYLGDPGSSGDSAFHTALSEYRKVYEYSMPCWPGINERCSIYEL